MLRFALTPEMLGSSTHPPSCASYSPLDERVQRLTAATARAVLVGNTAELSPVQCCSNCGAVISAA